MTVEPTGRPRRRLPLGRRPDRGFWLRRLLARSVRVESSIRVGRRNIVAHVLLACVVVLIVLNVVLLLQLNRLMSGPSLVLAQTADQVARLRNETFTYTLRIDQNLHVQTDVPFRKTVQVPINTTLPIDTTITVPVDSPFGRLTLPVPIKTTLPVSLTVSTPISETLPIDTNVPVRADVPVTIHLEDTPLRPYLEELERALRSMH